MKAGDLVTLSAYALQKADLWKVRELVWKQKKPLVGLIVRTEENPYNHDWTSKNEKTFYYIKWMQDYGPTSRYGSHGYRAKHEGYFQRSKVCKAKDKIK